MAVDIDSDRVTADRLERWGRALRSENAVPVIVLGLKLEDDTIIVTTVEGMPDGLLMDALVSAARMIAEGKAVPG